jgi:hypothetical protein
LESKLPIPGFSSEGPGEGTEERAPYVESV